MGKPFDYIAEANVTASNNFHGDKVPLHTFQANLLTLIELIQRLDQIKKTIFYGRELPGAQYLHKGDKTCATLPETFCPDDPKRGELLIHSIVGKATECGELLELLNNVLFNSVPFDEVNFIEEIGDGHWYDAIGLAQVNATFDEVQRINIAKLRHRFPNKFTEYDANNRDLFAERQILEDGQNVLDTPAGMSAANEAAAIQSELREKPQVLIENWLHMGNVLIGDVVGHPRLGNERGVKTSLILNMDEVNGICETKNTIYTLGKPYVAVPRTVEEMDAAKAILDKA